MRNFFQKYIRKIPYLRSLFLEIDQLKAEIGRYKTWVPPGHFYSPIPNIDEIKNNEKEIFNKRPRKLPGLELNEREQIKLLEIFQEFYDEIPFDDYEKEGLRYFFKNLPYSYSDAIFLYAMIRYMKPNKIVEVGSGYSSSVILDVNELFFKNMISCTFIDPKPQLFLSLIKDEDMERITLIKKKLQDVEIGLFSDLSSGDILLIDSTHVSKTDSDVNHIFFRILPCIRAGVNIHFHDIFYPFEYPKEWVYRGIAWNEAYMLRAFLQYNKTFKIQFFSSFLECFHRDWFEKEMPLCLKNKGGSIWIKKIVDR